MEEKNLTLEQENVIKEKAKKLKTEGKYRKVFPMVVFGDTELIDNESLFLFGLMGQLSEVISTRLSTIVNF